MPRYPEPTEEQLCADYEAKGRAEHAARELQANRSIALNNFAAPDVRVAAFKSMPKAEQWSMLAELGIERFDTYAWTSHTSGPLQPTLTQDHTEPYPMPPSKEARRNSVPQDRNAEEPLDESPLGNALDEYGDLLADLGSTIDHLEDKLRPVLSTNETPCVGRGDEGDSTEAPAVAYARSHNACLSRRIDCLRNIIDRLEC